MRTLWLTSLTALLLLAAAAPASRAQGLACAQDCSSGSCAQADCAAAAAGGFCECGGGALPWGGDSYLAYCRAWGAPQAGCGRATPAPDPSAIAAPTAAAPAPLPSAAAMEGALAAQNPYVATAIKALRDGDGWAAGPVHGLLHGARYESASGLAHGPALAFVGQVTATGAGAFQIDVTIAGDTSQLALPSLAAAAPAAFPPQSIHGTVTGGGLHGSLAVTAPAGSLQNIEW